MRSIMLKIASILFALAFPVCHAGEQNHYFDSAGYYKMTTEAYSEALPPPDALRVPLPDFTLGVTWPKVNDSRDGWIVVVDHFGKTAWYEGEEKKVGFHGPLPDGWSLTPPEPTPPTLAEAKVMKKSSIDTNTNRIRDRDGLAFDGNRFAMSDGAMLKWTGMMAAKDMLQFPFAILTIDDHPYILQNQTALLGFLVAVMGYETAPDSPLTTGRALRQQVEAATTIEEVEAIVDERQ